MTLSLSASQLELELGCGRSGPPCLRVPFPAPFSRPGVYWAGERGPAPLAMGLGMTLSFATIGMLVGALGPALGIDGDTVRTSGAALLIIFAVIMLTPALSGRFSHWMTPIASAANSASRRLNSSSLFGALALGWTYWVPGLELHWFTPYSAPP